MKLKKYEKAAFRFMLLGNTIAVVQLFFIVFAYFLIPPPIGNFVKYLVIFPMLNIIIVSVTFTAIMTIGLIKEELKCLH